MIPSLSHLPCPLASSSESKGRTGLDRKRNFLLLLFQVHLVFLLSQSVYLALALFSLSLSLTPSNSSALPLYSLSMAREEEIKVKLSRHKDKISQRRIHSGLQMLF